MDLALSYGSSLPQIWAVEALACSKDVEPSLLLDLLRETPNISNNIGKNARELVSLKILERLFIQGGLANPESSALSKTVKLDSSDHCEDVLRRILNETSLSHQGPAETEISKWDLETFIEHKRSTLPRCALEQLKDAIISGSLSISTTLREKSGLLSHADHQAPAKDGSSYGITPRVEESDINDGNLLPTDLSDENLVPVSRKRRASEGPAEQLCTNHINPIKKNKHDIISNELQVGEQFISSGVHKQISDISAVSVQHIEGARCGVETNEYTSSGLGVPSEVLPCGKQVLLHPDTEVNKKSEKQQRQDQNIEAPDFRKTNEDVNRFEPYSKIADEVEENVHVADDNDGNDDGMTNISRKEDAPVSPQFTNNRNSSETLNSRDQIVLPDTSKRYSEGRCRVEEETCPEGMSQHGNENGHVLPHCDIEVLNVKIDVVMHDRKGENKEIGRKGCQAKLTDDDIDEFDQNVPITIRTVDEDISSDTDGYHDERASIDSKKQTFLSSQCTHSQDLPASSDTRELHLCMKCDKGGNVLSCASGSCPIVIHESCLGSYASFDTKETFYCPFCAYSRAISKYMEVKKHTSLARKDLTVFICSGPLNESNKQSKGSFRSDRNCMKQNDGLPKGNELNQTNLVEKVTDHQQRKKLEFEQAGPSELRSDYSPPFGRKPVMSKRDEQDGKRMKQKSQPQSCRQPQKVAEAVHNFQSEATASLISETSGSEKRADIRSKKGVPNRPDLPTKNALSSQYTDAEEISEDEAVRKQERKNLYPAIPQLRRKKVPWTSEEENTLKIGIRTFCSPGDRIFPWRKILEFGEGKFQPSRSAMDLKDKWRNMCKANL